MSSDNWERDSPKIRARILEFEPKCIKCGYELGELTTNNGTSCPKCAYSIIDSACQQMDLHFVGYNVPPELMKMFKKGIRMSDPKYKDK